MPRSGLFPDEALAAKALLGDEGLRNAAAEEIWKRREVDLMLDIYLSGADPGRIAVTLKRTRKAVIRKLQEYIYNERNRSVDYVPKLRQSRKGKHLTKNELQIIRECHRKGVSWEQIALVLQRDVSEIHADSGTDNAKALARQLRQAAPGVDLLLAYRFLYYVKRRKVIPNQAYDDLKLEETEYGGGGPLLDKFRRTGEYPAHIQALARYLLFKHKENKS